MSCAPLADASNCLQPAHNMPAKVLKGETARDVVQLHVSMASPRSQPTLPVFDLSPFLTHKASRLQPTAATSAGTAGEFGLSASTHSGSRLPKPNRIAPSSAGPSAVPTSTPGTPLTDSSGSGCQAAVEDDSLIKRCSGGGAAHANNAEVAALAAGVAECLVRTGCLVVRDPRVPEADNQRFLDLMESYFAQDWERKQPDVRPELHYQVGATPEGVEVPRAAREADLQHAIRQQPPAHRAALPTGPDPKWRYMWRIGPRPDTTQYAELNAEPVVPEGFPQWAEVMDGWGGKMLAAVDAVAELAAVGLGLPPDSFTQRMRLGPHLLAPTGTNLEAHGEVGACYAGYHYDLNFLTIHGKSRFPGLHVWLRDGRRVAVAVPPGCLFLQAGKQLEWLTGGHITAGMHEVVCTDATRAAVEAARQAGRPLWRVSSTVFAHIASDTELRPLGRYATRRALQQHPPQPTGRMVQTELEAIQLKAC